MLDVHRISAETICPIASSIPQKHNTIQLSLLDQISPHIYTNIVLFYSAVAASNAIADKLKASLSETLVYFYPFAGTIQVSEEGTIYIECTEDDGVEFIEATSESNMDSVILDKQSSISELDKLLPIKKSGFSYGDPLLALQLTVFRNGGFAVGFCFSHVIADGATMAMFLSGWTKLAHGLMPDQPVFDSASVFPPRPGLTHDQVTNSNELENVAIKRFIITSTSMEKLREPDGNKKRPSRVEAALALVWRCLTRARGATAAPPSVSQVVSFRSKMSPLLSSCSCGNLWVGSVASVPPPPHEQTTFEEALRKAAKRVDAGYLIADAERQIQGGSTGVGWIFSSWCRMKFNEVDLGWGKPEWVACALKDMRDVCILTDCKEGVGVEVWLWLEMEEMEKVQRDTEFLEFVSVD